MLLDSFKFPPCLTDNLNGASEGRPAPNPGFGKNPHRRNLP